MTSTIAKIYIDNLRHNLNLIRSKINKNAKMCVAVKADAYGHGAVECAKVALECGAEYLAIARVCEGVELRNAGITAKLLMLSLANPQEMEELVRTEITPLVFDSEYAELVAEAAKKAGKAEYAVHLAVDTGMGRIGCLPEEAGAVAKKITGLGLKFEGICTHFAAADSENPSDREYTEFQFKRFMEAVENVKKAGIDPGIRHCANSALTLDKPEYHLDMCRPGIIVYGYYPDTLDREYFARKGENIELKPVMALCTKVVAVRKFTEGRSISYGRTWTCGGETDIGVLPIGYADGLFRRFARAGGNSEDLKVAINGTEYPVRGRICMDQCMVDLGKDSAVERFTEAVIFGPEESGALQTAQKIADQTGTISYEVTCGVGKRVPRVFLTSLTR
ncbi:MAG: alanine racemase [Treponema sp.]|nr:alanine racemase [Candidatus Treponema equifaecale]